MFGELDIWSLFWETFDAPLLSALDLSCRDFRASAAMNTPGTKGLSVDGEAGESVTVTAAAEANKAPNAAI